MGIGGFMSKFASNKSNPIESSEHIVFNSSPSSNPLNGQNTRQEPAQFNTNPVTPIVDDELSTRLFTSVVGIVEDRRQLVQSLDECKRYLRDADQTIEQLKQEKKSAQLLVERKEEEIESNRRQLADKQLKYDQLLEDYKQLRANDAKEYERLQDQLREMRLNYENLNADYTRYRSESAKEVEKLEAELRTGMVRYHQLLEKFNKVKEENTRLTSHIVNFAQQMTGLQAPVRSTEPVSESPVPIQPVVPSGSQESGNL